MIRDFCPPCAPAELVAQVSACATYSAPFPKTNLLQNNALQKYPPFPIRPHPGRGYAQQMTRPHPEFWYPIARLLSALRALLRATAPEAFAAIAKEARAQLMAAAALVRRYIHVLAAELVLPPPCVRPPSTEHVADARASRRSGGYLFPLIEGSSRASRSTTGEDPPSLQWALLMEAAARLAEVLANPAPHARRLARRFGTLLVSGLRELPARWHVIRRVGPGIDTLLLRLDQAARPEAWAGMDTS